MHYQHSKEGKDGKRKSYFLYFLNDVQILKQKAPYDENRDEGYNGKWHIGDVYLYNGRIYQTRSEPFKCGETFKSTTDCRFVSYPVSKKILNLLEVPNNLKIIKTEV